jgi:hypothetical protein
MVKEESLTTMANGTLLKNILLSSKFSCRSFLSILDWLSSQMEIEILTNRSSLEEIDEKYKKQLLDTRAKSPNEDSCDNCSL